jgi:outer membrane protein assembly factor BamE (lipoprotein component of BamABCDE complex)
MRWLLTLLAATVVLADEPLQLKALRRAPITQLRDDDRSAIGYLARGETVTVLEVGESKHLVAARCARGWVEAKALEAPPAELLESIRKQREQAATHRELIARHEVAPGMTREEVRASLGKPDRRSRAGMEEQWFYVTYRYLPSYSYVRDEQAHPRQVVAYQRLPAGHKVVTFQGQEVAAVEDDVEQQARPAMPKITN